MRIRQNLLIIFLFTLIFSSLGVLILFFRASEKLHEGQGEKINISGNQRRLNQKHLKEVLLVKQGLIIKDSVFSTRKELITNLELLTNLSFDEISETTLTQTIQNTALANSLLNDKTHLSRLFSLSDSVLETNVNAPFYSTLVRRFMKAGYETHASLDMTVRLYVEEYGNEISTYNRLITFLFTLLFILSILSVFLFSVLLKKRKHLSLEIIKRKEAEENMSRYLKKLEKINEELTHFAYITSHDLKSPLQSMKGLAELLESDLNKQDYSQIRTYFNLFGDRLNYMFFLIDGILEYSRIEKTELKEEELDVKELVEESIKLAAGNNASNIELMFKTKIPEIKANKVRLLQVFNNLISNAIKYNDKEITRIVIGYSYKDRTHVFSIEDNGPGIPFDKQQKIFQLFERSTENHKVAGTGVGLFIVKKIIQDKKGNIWLESDGKSGTRFCFTWPE